MSANDGFRAASDLHGGARADELVVVQDGQSARVPDRDDRAREPAVGPGLGSPGVRLSGEGVHVGAAEALDGRDQVGADALRHEAGGQRGGRVHRPGAAVRAHRHPAHRLHAACDDE